MKKVLLALLLLATLQSDSQVSDNQVVLYKRRVVAGVETAPPGDDCGTADQTDNFNRADSADIGTDWSPVQGQLQIVSNTVQAWDGNDAIECFIASWGDNQCSEAKITAASADAGVGYGVAVRCDPVLNSWYRLVINGDGEWELGEKFEGGSFGSLATGTTTYSAGAILRLTVVGTALKGYYNGSQIVSVTDPTLTEGYPGIAYSSAIASGNIDDWAGY